jgi:hypothetical protein
LKIAVRRSAWLMLIVKLVIPFGSYIGKLVFDLVVLVVLVVLAAVVALDPSHSRRVRRELLRGPRQ